jgi:hypothetical protein
VFCGLGGCMNINDLIKKWGLLENPFSVSSAEHEIGLININRTDFFIKPYYFDQIIGTPKAPISSIVYGFRGDGKSCICNAIKKELSNSRVLIVEYTDFKNINMQIIEKISLDYHINQIIRLCLAKLIEEIERIPLKLFILDKDKKITLAWFISKYHPKSYESLDILQNRVGDFSIPNRLSFAKKVCSNLKSYYRSIIKDSETKYKYKYLGALTSLDSLKELIDIIKYSGFDSTYIIIDKLDENGDDSLSHIQLSKFISPLLSSLHYLELKHFATIFFIPSQVWYAINSDNIRLDRIDKFEIRWSNKELLNMLNIRLKSFSAPEKQVSYSQFFCPMSLNYFENNLLYYSAKSPRNLLRLFNDIIISFCELEEEYTDIVGYKHAHADTIECINKKAINEGIRYFYKKRLWESDSELYIDKLKETIRDYNKDELYIPYNI